MRALVLALLIPLVASCGGGGSNNKSKQPDAPPSTDSPAATCGSTTNLTAGAPSFLGGDMMGIQWGGTVMGDVGDGGTLSFQAEFYSGIETSLAGTFPLDSGNQANYMTCAICFRAFSVDSQNMLIRQWFQSGGSITLSEDPFTRQHMVGSITNLAMDEVTVDMMSFMSTPVPNGKCVLFGNMTLNADNVPAGWTCDHAKWMDGTTCDCMCGLQDPDCNNHANTVNGCTTTGQVCFNGTCATPPANDTCATALPLVLGTATTGSTAGANNDYSMGLDAMTCTGVTQDGPDVAYHIALTAGTSYTFSLTMLDAGYDGSISLVGPGAATVCSANITTCVAGADAGTEGMDETFQYTVPAGGTGTYYVIVDSFYPTEGGAFTVKVTSP
jgi:hypothetical protein